MTSKLNTLCTFSLEYLFLDSEAGLELENKRNGKNAGTDELYYAGIFLWLMDKNDEGLDRMLEMSPGSGEVVCKWYFIHNMTEVLTI